MTGEQNVHLYGELLRQAAVDWRNELGMSDHKPLDMLLDLATTERILLSDCLATLFPRSEATKAQAALTKLSERLNVAAEGGWRTQDPDTGELRILPAETFGPLPVAAS